MFLSDDRLICSASDLAGFLACRRLTALGLRAPRGEVERPETVRSLTAAHGDRHERRYLDAMKGPRPAAGSERVRSAGPTSAQETTSSGDLSYRTTHHAPRTACVELIWDATGQRPVARTEPISRQGLRVGRLLRRRPGPHTERWRRGSGVFVTRRG